MTDVEEQENEILVLSSIFEDEIFNSFKLNQKSAVRFVIDVDFGSKTLEIKAKFKDGDVKSTEISYLPPIYCTCILPSVYPSTSNPDIHLVASWLYPQLITNIRDKLRSISAENPQSPILFLYYQCIKDETFDLIDNPLNLNLCKSSVNKIRLKSSSDGEKSSESNNENNNSLNDSNISSLLNSTKQKSTAAEYADAAEENLFQSLIDFDQFQKRRQFEKSIVLCEICYAENLGVDCVVFQPCQHTFCRACCRSFFELHIKEGGFELLKCMANECQSPAHQLMIKNVVSEEMFERYDKMTLTRSLDMMRDVVICPRPGCGAFVVADDQDSRMAWCSVCLFAFCTLCKKVYHGVAACQLNSTDVTNIFEEYTNGDDEIKTKIEDKYGKLVVKRLIEDASSDKWLMENCRKCPSCRAPIQKKDGCNKMWCSKCGSYFCWLCMKCLSRENPYNHFNDPASLCFNSLFRGVDPEEEADDGDAESSDDEEFND